LGKRRTQLEQWQDDLVASFEMRLFPVTKALADRWAVLSAQSQRKGVALANIDGLIAVIALEHDLTLVTRNVKDFCRRRRAALQPLESMTVQIATITRPLSSKIARQCGVFPVSPASYVRWLQDHCQPGTWKRSSKS
jgi:hypothetical protein